MNASLPKRVLLGVTGGIAAYKSAELVRRLREQGAEVQVVMTEGARQFVGPLTFQALSGRPVRSDLWDAAAEAAMGHIELARWAERIADRARERRLPRPPRARPRRRPAQHAVPRDGRADRGGAGDEPADVGERRRRRRTSPRCARAA